MVKLTFNSKRHTLENDQLVIVSKVEGTIGKDTCSQLQDELLGFYTQGASCVILTLTAVESFDEEGKKTLAAIYDKYQKGGKKLIFTNVPVGSFLSDGSFFATYDSENQALQHISQPPQEEIVIDFPQTKRRITSRRKNITCRINLPDLALPPLLEKYQLEIERESSISYKLYLATNNESEQRVLVKVLPVKSPSQISDRNTRQFLQQIVIMKKLYNEEVDGQKIVPKIHYQAQLDGNPCYVMEYIKGHSLKEEMERGIIFERALEIGIKISKVVSLMHQLRIIHRDICPENILIVEQMVDEQESDIRVVINDFSIGDIENLNLDIESHHKKAIPRLELGYREDVFALGTILYQMLTHKNLRTTSEDPTSNPQKIRNINPMLLDILGDTKMMELEQIIEQTLSRNPEQIQKAQSIVDTLVSLRKNIKSKENRLDSPPQILCLSKEAKSRYQPEIRVGRGGFAEIYKAFDVENKKYVALKVPTWEQDTAKEKIQEILMRLRREAQALNIRHPNLCEGYGLIENGNILVMEFIEGEQLEQFISDEQRYSQLSETEKLRIVKEIAEAICVLHQNHIIHRDITTRNILLTIDSEKIDKIKLIDLGIAKVYGELTVTMSPFVSIGYSSPEQFRGQRIDMRSDVFSLGAVMYRIFNRHHPFGRGQQAMQKFWEGNLTPQPLLPDIPKEIANIILKALQYNRDDRYPTMQSMLDDIKAYSITMSLKQSENISQKQHALSEIKKIKSTESLHKISSALIDNVFCLPNIHEIYPELEKNLRLIYQNMTQIPASDKEKLLNILRKQLQNNNPNDNSYIYAARILKTMETEEAAPLLLKLFLTSALDRHALLECLYSYGKNWKYLVRINMNIDNVDEEVENNIRNFFQTRNIPFDEEVLDILAESQGRCLLADQDQISEYLIDKDKCTLTVYKTVILVEDLYKAIFPEKLLNQQQSLEGIKNIFRRKNLNSNWKNAIIWALNQRKQKDPKIMRFVFQRLTDIIFAELHIGLKRQAAEFLDKLGFDLESAPQGIKIYYLLVCEKYGRLKGYNILEVLKKAEEILLIYKEWDPGSQDKKYDYFVSWLVGKVSNILASTETNDDEIKRIATRILQNIDNTQAINDAIEKLSLMLLKDTNNCSLYISRGYLYYINNNHPNALNDYLKALEIEPENPTVYHYLGIFYCDQGDYLQAITNYVKVCKLRPQDQYIHSILAELLKNDAVRKNISFSLTETLVEQTLNALVIALKNDELQIHFSSTQPKKSSVIFEVPMETAIYQREFTESLENKFDELWSDESKERFDTSWSESNENFPPAFTEQEIADHKKTVDTNSRRLSKKETKKTPSLSQSLDEKLDQIWCSQSQEEKKEVRNYDLTSIQELSSTLLHPKNWDGNQIIQAEYYGEVYEEIPNGSGKCKFFYGDNWAIFEGSWLNGMPNGRGVLYANGEKYEGEFRYGKFHGVGTLYHAHGKYHGSWENSKRYGQGHERWVNGDNYQGEYLDSQFHGVGTFYYTNGDKYHGEWKKGKKHGHGVFTFASGDEYQGGFCNDLFDGEGTYYGANGDIYQSRWKSGHRVDENKEQS